jgi:glycine/D-amino acid oxidase-like deaminating enzyme
VSAIRTWTGFRPATPDKLPLIGAWDETPGLWIAAGHEGLGITTALGTASLLADLVLGREPAIDAAPFAPARVHGHSDAAVIPAQAGVVIPTKVGIQVTAAPHGGELS